MASLTNCIRKAGDLLPADLSARIVERATELHANGLSLSAAARRAVEEVSGAVESQRVEVETAFKEGRTLYAEAPAREEGETQQADSPLERMAQEQPDRLVTLPGEDKPIPLSEAVVKIAEDEADEAFTAELVRVAGECALMFGA